MAYQINPFTGKLDITPFSLDGAGKIPSDYLPSYVDDVVEYDDLASFPGTGETGKIYVAKDTGYTYRWTGSVYVRIGSGGEVALNLGSEGSPSLYFTGDTNTGIYSPGTDQVAISTNGTQRINIEADGDINIDSGGVFYDATNNRLAIGTTSPGAKLEVNGGEIHSVNGPVTQYLSSGGGVAVIGTLTNTDWTVRTNNNEKLRVDTSGRLLVGTTIGTAKLTVQDARVEVRNSNGASIGNSTTTSVSTTATTIIDDAGFQGRLWVINGADASNRFCDLVMASTSVVPVVVQSFSALGTPAARTYTRSGSAVQLAMASGTYDVRCIGFGA